MTKNDWEKISSPTQKAQFIARHTGRHAQYYKTFAGQRQEGFYDKNKKALGAGLVLTHSASKSSAQAAASRSAAQAEALAAQTAALAEKRRVAQELFGQSMAVLSEAYKKRSSLLRASYDTTLAGLQTEQESASDSANVGIDRALQEAYISRIKSERDLPNQLAAMGISGGLSESALAGVRNQYGTARNSLERSRADQLVQIALQIQKSKSAALQNYQTQLAADEKQRLADELSLRQRLAAAWGL
ncbi:MAG: hypothetical protein RSF90_03690 [Pygmaiobacter sp.]